MSYVCPKDLKGCCDDMCHGAGCLRMNGYAMLLVCDFCHGLIDEEIPECSSCTCEREHDDDDCFDGPPLPTAVPDDGQSGRGG